MDIFYISWYCFEKAALDLIQKSLILMIIQGVVLAFSLWDKNSRFFVILAAIGVYSVYGNISVRINLRRIETAVKEISKVRSRQFARELDIRRENIFSVMALFIPEKERELPHSPFYRARPGYLYQS